MKAFKYGQHFESHYGGALTLNPNFIGKNKSGWTISGDIKEDYYTWVNEFVAEHPVYGKIRGDFEKTVYAESEEAFNHFYENHKPSDWDYQDI